MYTVYSMLYDCDTYLAMKLFSIYCTNITFFLQLAGGMWPNCIGAVSKTGIRCPHQLVVGGGNRDIVIWIT